MNGTVWPHLRLQIKSVGIRFAMDSMILSQIVAFAGLFCWFAYFRPNPADNVRWWDFPICLYALFLFICSAEFWAAQGLTAASDGVNVHVCFGRIRFPQGKIMRLSEALFLWIGRWFIPATQTRAIPLIGKIQTQSATNKFTQSIDMPTLLNAQSRRQQRDGT